MPYLGDYLGQLLSEISMARMQADLETVRLAELYAQHPLLRTMPVPHVRLPDVDLEVPVLIKQSEEPREGETSRGGASLAEMKRSFDRTLHTHLAKAGVELSPDERKRLRAAVKDRLTLHELPETSIDVHRVADDLSATATRFVAERKGPAVKGEAVSPKFGAQLQDAARLAMLKLRKPPPRLFVLVTTSEIREAGAEANIMKLRLKVSEQGVEWATVESEGMPRDRLVPE